MNLLLHDLLERQSLPWLLLFISFRVLLLYESLNVPNYTSGRAAW